MKVIERLETLKRLNRDPLWVNRDLFRIACSPQMAVLAYERLKSKPGNMTAGDDGVTLDRVSLEGLERLCDAVRTEAYQPTPVRRKYIPKADGKRRPLGIPSPRDKIVQEMVREILEAIYDSPAGPTFTDHNHGFRRNRSCHTAVEAFSTWQGTTWIIEGDIQGYFDSIDHAVLVGLLRKRIQDERFINLVWKFLRTPIREENGDLRSSRLGTPQGGVLSPILANIYLHEFDRWCVAAKADTDAGKKRRLNPEWRSIWRRRGRLLGNGQATADSEIIRELTRKALKLPTVMVNDPEFRRLNYVRYADDWIIGVVGPRALAEEIKSKAEKFLTTQLKLTLSQEKTFITHARNKHASFLGFHLSVGSSVKRRRVAAAGKRVCVKRVTGWQPRVEVPIHQLVSTLHARGFCAQKGSQDHFPKSKATMVALEDHDIIMGFNAIWRGIFNYHCICDNVHALRWVMYILQYSCLMTIGHKHRCRVPNIIKRLGVFPQKTYRIASGEERTVQFWKPISWQPGQKQPDLKLLPPPDQVIDRVVSRVTRSHLYSPCAACGHLGRTEMHHVRALRKGNKTITKGFNRIMSAINRKQVPLCESCHDKVHAGQYDGMKLSDMAYVPQ